MTEMKDKALVWSVIAGLIIIAVIIAGIVVNAGGLNREWEYKTVTVSGQRVGITIANMEEDGWKLTDRTETGNPRSYVPRSPYASEDAKYYALTFRRRER